VKRPSDAAIVKSDHKPLSAAYHEFDGDGLPTVQARRGGYDVNHYHRCDETRAASRETTVLDSLARKRQVGDLLACRVLKGRHRPAQMPRLRRSVR